MLRAELKSAVDKKTRKVGKNYACKCTQIIRHLVRPAVLPRSEDRQPKQRVHYEQLHYEVNSWTVTVISRDSLLWITTTTSLSRNASQQTLHIHVPLSSSSIIWFWPNSNWEGNSSSQLASTAGWLSKTGIEHSYQVWGSLYCFKRTWLSFNVPSNLCIGSHAGELSEHPTHWPTGSMQPHCHYSK